MAKMLAAAPAHLALGRQVALTLWDGRYTRPPADHLPDFPEWWTLGLWWECLREGSGE